MENNNILNWLEVFKNNLSNEGNLNTKISDILNNILNKVLYSTSQNNKLQDSKNIYNLLYHKYKILVN